ncbi:ribokinase [Brachybacterium aquaticum]|uniref:Ribokinase n=1 Tax=Brachybacterium aquaticum TaxID=1432564 RepID=A0A841ADY2_9MICO|nr:ribokinase [Brachybacterium aquaticum]MBB5833036.1 ribokinase [Brachybacterium aquaticum]
MNASTPPPADGSIVVVGSVNVDLLAQVQRHPAPGETLHGTGGQMLPGGKGANQAVAAARLGARVTMVGAVGTDAQAEVALSALREAGVDLTHLAEIEGPTGLAIVTVAEDGENSIVVIAGANDAMDAGRVRAAREAIAAARIVVCQGEIPRDGIEALPALVTGRFLHNPAPVMELDPAVLRASDPLVVNQHEAGLVLAQLAGEAPDAPDTPAPTDPDAVVRALQAQAIASVVLTLGADGARVADADGIQPIPPAPVDAVDTTGAGDAFIGALALGLARGDDLATAARLASRVGAYAATGEGAQPSYPSADDTLPALQET